MNHRHTAPYDIGDKVVVHGMLTTTNDVGGTRDLKHPMSFGTVCEVTHAFFDDETGWRFYGKVLDEETVSLFRKQATTGYTPEFYAEKYGEDSPHVARTREAAAKFDPADVRFSEFDSYVLAGSRTTDRGEEVPALYVEDHLQVYDHGKLGIEIAFDHPEEGTGSKWFTDGAREQFLECRRSDDRRFRAFVVRRIDMDPRQGHAAAQGPAR